MFWVDSKNSREKNYRKVNENSKFWNFEFSLTFRWFCFLDFFWSRKKYFSDFFKIFFDFEKKNLEKNILKSKICSGIQKSYLENRTSILKLFKIKNPIFLTQIEKIPYSVTYTDPSVYELLFSKLAIYNYAQNHSKNIVDRSLQKSLRLTRGGN